MKIPRISRRLVLCAVLVLATVGMFLVPAASVTAADQAWPLQLVGATTVNITQDQFETMAAANPSNEYTDSDNNTWRGVALWRLVALVDDGDPSTFSDALASVYSVKMSAFDGFSRTEAPVRDSRLRR
ncbi:MAG TPA: hypothetical protein VN415_06060, partial [Dehalococcoidia bacterium]|nr:hypothetical protein [Dehalococcoidia bacterium]